MENILQVKELNKSYQSGRHLLKVLDNINFEVPSGSSLSIVGPSGSGKTTLLGVCAGLESPDSGEVILNGYALKGLSEDQRASVRNHYVGFVFQNFQLLPTLTAIENVMVPMELKKEKNIQSRAKDLLKEVGLVERAHHYPAQLSGGEQQRISLARAFSNNPKILFADEPTGNLDEETAKHIEELLFSLNRNIGTTLILVTHNLELAAKTSRIIKIKGGSISDDYLTDKNLHIHDEA